ncbi:MAG TPA: nitronate monooxygenase family protein [Stellaceae bacterium]|nr:nitronate monooxygenase family protein [Stellaceae bacterium]
MWPDRRLADLFGIEHPILLAPMAGAIDWEIAAAVAEAGGLGAIPAAMLDAQKLAAQVASYRANTKRPVNLNFFCHQAPVPSNARETAWRDRLKPYYRELGIDPAAPVPSSMRAPFDEPFCAVVEELRPEVVSFHFGLPEKALLARVKAAGCRVLSSATTAAEAKWLEEAGCDAVIAQGSEAGGHRGMFLTDDLAAQVGTFALVPQVVDAVKVPVIAAGGVSDARGIAAAFALGAAGVQVGTTYLWAAESKISALHRKALAEAGSDATALTNVMSGRPARGILNRAIRELGPVCDVAPEFPLAAGALAPLRAKAEAQGSGDFSPLWAGQAAALGRALPAAEATRRLAAEAQELMRNLAGR